MRNFLAIFLCLSMVFACGPTRHAIQVEMRYPSLSGIELSDKIISVVYVSGENQQSNVINENMAISFASTLESEYGTGEGSVGVFSVDEKSGNYAQKDSLISLLMQTDSDLVLLLDKPEFGEKGSAQPVKVRIHCFDGMDKETKVQTFSGSKVFTIAPDEATLASEAVRTGKQLAVSFAPQWRHEQYSIAYYDSTKWFNALEKAEMYDWKGAMDIWFELLDTNDMMKRATAEYNIAVACYMLGDFDLAAQWLDRSDADNKMPTLSDPLRKRIDSRIK